MKPSRPSRIRHLRAAERRYARQNQVGKKPSNLPFFFVSFSECTEFLRKMEPWGILAAIIGLWLTFEQMSVENESRQQDRIVNAWQLVTTPASGNSGKKEALEYLFNQGVSLTGVDLSCKSNRGTEKFAREVTCLRPVQLENISFVNDDPILAKMGDPMDTSSGVYKIPYLHMRFLDRNNFTNANFEGADLTGAEFIGIDLTKSVFKNATLRRSFFDYSIVRNVTLPRDIRHSSFQNAILSNVDIQPPADWILEAKEDPSTEVFFTFNNLNLNLNNAFLHDFDFGGHPVGTTDFTNASFLKVNVSGIDFSDALGITQKQMDNAWAWSDDMPSGLPNKMKVGTICIKPSRGKSEASRGRSIERFDARMGGFCEVFLN